MSGEKPIEYWISRATDPYADVKTRHNYLESLCNKINHEADGASVAVEILTHKIISPDQDEALHSLQAVDAMVRRCGDKVHAKVGKYRFLNQYVKLLTPKYLGAQTSKEVKELAIKVLYTWQRSLKHIGKFKEVYELLKENELITQDPAIPEEDIIMVPQTSKFATFEDEEKSKLLKHLLASGSPEDLEAANRLIKSLVRSEEVKVAKVHQRKTDLERAQELCENITECCSDSALTSITNVQQLYDELVAMRPTLYKHVGELAETEDPNLEDVLNVNDLVNKTISNYSSPQKFRKTQDDDKTLLFEKELLDFAHEGKNEGEPSSDTTKVTRQLEDLLDGMQREQQASDVPFIGFNKNMTPALPRRSGQKSMSIPSGSIFETDFLPERLVTPKKLTLNDLYIGSPTTSTLSFSPLEGKKNGVSESTSTILAMLPETILFDPSSIQLDVKKPLAIFDKNNIRILLYWTKNESSILSYVISIVNFNVHVLKNVHLSISTADRKVTMRLTEMVEDLPGFQIVTAIHPMNLLLSVLPLQQMTEAEFDYSITFTHEYTESVSGCFTLPFN